MGGRRVVLGVTGGIASYKAVSLARLLAQRDAEVDVVMTRGAQQFVGAVTFEGVTGRRVYSDLFEPGQALAHIRLAREADVIVVAPATADFLARAAHGRSDDLLSAMLLAARCPVVLAPAMNDRMWSHPQTRNNADHLRSLGYELIDPDTGPLAFDEGEGPGRLPEPETLLAYVERALGAESALRGKTVVVSAGATREPIDPVRFISNRSTGKMGVAIARAAWLRGASVKLVAGAIDVQTPTGIDVTRAETADSMAREIERLVQSADVLLMAAAPADFRPAHVASAKIKKASGLDSLELATTTDILRASMPSRKPGMIAVGFALETDDLIENARSKLQDKALDMVVANRAGVPGEGFGADTNRVTLITAEAADELPLMSKGDVAEAILDRVEKLLSER